MGKFFDFKIEVDIPEDAQRQMKAAAEAAMKKVAAELTGRFDEAISGRYWPWPRNSNGKGKIRSIIDTGALKANRSFKLSGLTAEWVWGQEYAAVVHEGWRDESIYPGRPWTTAVLEGGTAGNAGGIEVYPFSDRFTLEFTRLMNQY